MPTAEPVVETLNAPPQERTALVKAKKASQAIPAIPAATSFSALMLNVTILGLGFLAAPEAERRIGAPAKWAIWGLMAMNGLGFLYNGWQVSKLVGPAFPLPTAIPQTPRPERGSED